MRYIRQELITLCFEVLYVFPGYMVLEKVANFPAGGLAANKKSKLNYSTCILGRLLAPVF